MENKKSKALTISFILSICLVVVCMAMFLFLAIRYAVVGKFNIDNSLIEFSTNIRNNFLTGFFKIFTHLGSIITILILTAIMAILIKPILVKIFVIANVGFVSVFCFVVKHIVNRPRPVGIALIEETGFSFPSAHSMVSVVFYCFLIFLIWKFLKNKPLKIVLSVILPIIAITIGYTRVYLGVHYITDVLAGIIAGIAYLIVAIWAYIIIEKVIKKKKGLN